MFILILFGFGFVCTVFNAIMQVRQDEEDRLKAEFRRIEAEYQEYEMESKSHFSDDDEGFEEVHEEDRSYEEDGQGSDQHVDPKLEHYQALNIENNASQKEIRAAYLRLAKKYHPDVNRAKNAAEKMKAINEAYEVLKAA